MSGEESKREKESGASNDQSNEKGKGGERESRHKNGHEISGGHYRAGIIWLLLAFSRMHVHFLYESFQRFVGLPPSIMECK